MIRSMISISLSITRFFNSGSNQIWSIFEQDLELAQVALNICGLMSTNACSKPMFCNHLIIGSLHCLFFCITSPALFFWVVFVPTSIHALKSPPMTISYLVYFWLHLLLYIVVVFFAPVCHWVESILPILLILFF